jgi:hypothetical protein
VVEGVPGFEFELLLLQDKYKQTVIEKNNNLFISLIPGFK